MRRYQKIQRLNYLLSEQLLAKNYYLTDVVCGQMEATMLNASPLRDEEAWRLFEKAVGRYVLDSHPDIPELAKTMAEECCCLPLALKTVGRAMRSISSIEEWEHAIKIILRYGRGVFAFEVQL